MKDRLERRMEMKHVIKGIFTTSVFSAAMLFIGCGGIEDSMYRGESLFELSGTVKNQGSSDIGTSDIHVGLMWIFDHGNGDEVGMMDSVVGAQFPAHFDLNLYSTPADSLLMTFDDASDGVSEDELPELKSMWPEGMKIGLAYIAVWEDTNGNGRFDYSNESNPDRIIGGAPDFVVVFMEGAAPPSRFYSDVLDGIIDGELQLGYTLLRTNGKQNCYEKDGKQVCGSWDQVVPVDSGTEVDLVLADNAENIFPNIN